jgi:hypothetical protein
MVAMYAINNKQKMSNKIIIYLKRLFFSEQFILRKTYRIIMKGTQIRSETFLFRTEFRIYNCKCEYGGR